MTAPAFDDVDAFGNARQPEANDSTDRVTPEPGPGVEAYQLEGYRLDGDRPDGTRRDVARRAGARRKAQGRQTEESARHATPIDAPTDPKGLPAKPAPLARSRPAPLAGPRPTPPLRRLIRARRARKAAAVGRLRPEDRPYARLGLLWAACLVVGLIGGSAVLAVVVAPVGLIAAASALRVARRDTNVAGDPHAGDPRPGDQYAGDLYAGDPGAGDPGPGDPGPGDRSRADGASAGEAVGASGPRTAVLAGVVVAPFVALGGPWAALLAGLVVIVGAALVADRLGCSPFGAALAVAAPVSAMCSLVAARGQGFAVALVLVAAVCFYDAAACLMGNRPTGGFLGVVSALLTLGALGFLVTALANPPFRGDRPWVFCLTVGVLAWVGVKVCRALMRGGPTLPALARLDSLVVAGPAWVIAVAFVLNR